MRNTCSTRSYISQVVLAVPCVLRVQVKLNEKKENKRKNNTNVSH